MFDARAFYCYKYFGSATMFLVHKMIEFSSKNERNFFYQEFECSWLCWNFDIILISWERESCHRLSFVCVCVYIGKIDVFELSRIIETSYEIHQHHRKSRHQKSADRKLEIWSERAREYLWLLKLCKQLLNYVNRKYMRTISLRYITDNVSKHRAVNTLIFTSPFIYTISDVCFWHEVRKTIDNRMR